MAYQRGEEALYHLASLCHQVRPRAWTHGILDRLSLHTTSRVLLVRKHQLTTSEFVAQECFRNEFIVDRRRDDSKPTHTTVLVGDGVQFVPVEEASTTATFAEIGVRALARTVGPNSAAHEEGFAVYGVGTQVGDSGKNERQININAF